MSSLGDMYVHAVIRERIERAREPRVTRKHPRR